MLEQTEMRKRNSYTNKSCTFWSNGPDKLFDLSDNSSYTASSYAEFNVYVIYLTDNRWKIGNRFPKMESKGLYSTSVISNQGWIWLPEPRRNPGRLWRPDSPDPPRPTASSTPSYSPPGSSASLIIRSGRILTNRLRTSPVAWINVWNTQKFECGSTPLI